MNSSITDTPQSKPTSNEASYANGEAAAERPDADQTAAQIASQYDGVDVDAQFNAEFNEIGNTFNDVKRLPPKERDQALINTAKYAENLADGLEQEQKKEEADVPAAADKAMQDKKLDENEVDDIAKEQSEAVTAGYIARVARGIANAITSALSNIGITR